MELEHTAYFLDFPYWRFLWLICHTKIEVYGTVPTSLVWQTGKIHVKTDDKKKYLQIRTKKGKNSVYLQDNKKILYLCPFAEYYLRYAVTPFFTISRISLVDGKRAGQKVHRTIAVAVQNVKPLYCTFCPALLKSAKNIVNKLIYPVLYCPLFPTKICWAILYVLIIKLTKGWDGGFREGGIRDGEIGDGEIIVEGGC